MDKRLFGKLPNGEDVYIYRLTDGTATAEIRNTVLLSYLFVPLVTLMLLVDLIRSKLTHRTPQIKVRLLVV